jgi:5'(3')-deoxyribonucleotidase
MRIYLDLDEVLCDFKGAALTVFGVTKNLFNSEHTPGDWDIVSTLNRLITPPNIEYPEFESIINKQGPDFWATLDPLPHFDQLIKIVSAITSEWYIVSDPCNFKYAAYQKLLWLQRRLGKNFDRLILTKHKHLLANKDSILIDDKDKNIDEFGQHGGIGIIFPTLHNHLHKHSNDPIGWLLDYNLAFRSCIKYGSAIN